MKIIYIIYSKLEISDGVQDKIKAQIMEWRQLDCEVLPIIFSLDGSIAESDWGGITIDYRTRSNLFNNGLNRIKALLRMRRILNKFSPDLIYSRSGSVSRFAAKFTGKTKHVVEINAHIDGEVESEVNSGRLDRSIGIKKSERQRFSLESSDGLISVTHAIKDALSYSKPSIVVANSIKIKGHQKELVSSTKSSLPTVLFIGSPNRAWHGLDRLLVLAKATEGKLHFIAAGVSFGENICPPNIEALGYLDADDLSQIMSSVDIGISSMALYRSGHYEACPLKTRSYAAACLPMILPYKDTAFITEIENPEWALEVSNRELLEESEIENIVEFCEFWRGKKIPVEAAESFFGSENLERKRVAFFKVLLQNKESTTLVK